MSGGVSKDGRRKRRRRRKAHGGLDAAHHGAAQPARAREETAAPGARAEAPDSELPESPVVAATDSPSSGAAVVAVVLFLWGQSLFVFDFLRKTVFEPADASPLVLVLPLLGGAAAAALLAAWAGHRGRRPVGGRLIHHLGVASGLLAVTAAALVVWLGPTVKQSERATREAETGRQLELVARALEQHRRLLGTHPVGLSAATLTDALVPELLPDGESLRDAWGRPVHYRPVDDGREYVLLSFGYDGLQDLPDEDYIDPSADLHGVNDLVIVSGLVVVGGQNWHAPGTSLVEAVNAIGGDELLGRMP